MVGGSGSSSLSVRRDGDDDTPGTSVTPWSDVDADQVGQRPRLVFGVSAALVVAFLISLILRREGSYYPPVDGWGVDLFELSMGAICVGRYFDKPWRSSPSGARAFPLVLGAACVMWALGDVAFTVESLGGATPSVPSVANGFWLGFFPLCFVAFVLVIRRGNSGSLIATSLDGLIVGLGVASLSGAYAFHTILTVTGGSALATATNMTYPVGDLLLLALAVGGLAILPRDYRRFLVIASLALASNALGDGFALLQPNSKVGYVTNAVAWPVSLMMLAIAAWVQPTNAKVRTAHAEKAGTEKKAGFVLPALGALASMSVLFSSSIGHVERTAVGIATAALLVVGVRLTLTIREAQALNSARFRSLIDNARDLILVTEADFQIAYITPSSQAVLDYAPQDLQGSSFTDIVHPDDTDTTVGRFRTLAAQTSATVDLEARVRHRDGTWRTIAWTATNLLGDPSVRGYVLNGNDVTEARRASEDLASARDTAMEASRLKSQFLASMSHEIRTPMNAVIGLNELLLSTDLDTEQHEYAAGVGTAAEGLLGIINDILDFSKVEAGKLELETIDFDLGLLLEDVVALLADKAQSKGLELLAHPHPELRRAVRGDPTRLRQVLVNLVSNAVKFTSSGEVVLRAEPTNHGRAATVVRFEVADTGLGIAPADQIRMFEPFSQADNSTTRRFGGTGLGLAIVRQLVELMGGELGLDSEVDRGSTFWFELPFVAPDVTHDLPRPTVPQFASLRAIVVDDNATNRLILREQLGSWGLRPDEAADAPSALEQIRAAATTGNSYDLAILDLNMPGMDGLELAHAIKADPTTAHAHLFLLSSSGRLPKDAAVKAELAGTMTKPVRQSELFNCLIEGLQMEPASDATDDTDQAPDVGPAERGIILLVEDNTMNQLVATRMLAKLGYRCDVANNGQEALAAIIAGEYDAVLMDCQMPVMDGYEATRQLRRLENGSGRRLPVVAMTAAAMQGDREACLEAGMDDYITKPIRTETIGQTLDRWISVKGSQPPESSVVDRARASDVVIDAARFSVLRDLDAGDGDLLTMLVDEYLKDGARLLTTLREAVAEGDPQTVERAAHTLKGSSANLGAVCLAEICGRLEALGRAAALGTAARLVRDADEAFAQARAALSIEVAEV
jgi:two-component system sensor histidine kinase/response regulator